MKYFNFEGSICLTYKCYHYFPMPSVQHFGILRHLATHVRSQWSIMCHTSIACHISEVSHCVRDCAVPQWLVLNRCIETYCTSFIQTFRKFICTNVGVGNVLTGLLFTVKGHRTRMFDHWWTVCRLWTLLGICNAIFVGTSISSAKAVLSFFSLNFLREIFRDLIIYVWLRSFDNFCPSKFW